jgi:hypothetical protein
MAPIIVKMSIYFLATSGSFIISEVNILLFFINFSFEREINVSPVWIDIMATSFTIK